MTNMDTIIFTPLIVLIACLAFVLYKSGRAFKAACSKTSLLRDELQSAKRYMNELRSRSSCSMLVSTLYTWSWSARSDILTFNKKAILYHGKHYTSAGGGNAVMIPTKEYIRSFIHEKHQGLAASALNRLIEGKTKTFSKRLLLRENKRSQEYDWGDIYGIATDRDCSGHALAIFGATEMSTENELLAKAIKGLTEEMKKAHKSYLESMEHISGKLTETLNEYTAMIREREETTDMGQRHAYTEAIQTARLRLTRMKHNISIMVKIVTGRWDFSESQCDLNIIMSICLASFEEKLEHNKNIKRELCCAHSSFEAAFNIEAIACITEQLLHNADKFTEQGYIRLGYEKPENGFVRIFVSDSGCGITADKRERIFKPYYTDDPANSGLGIGLPLAARLVKALGGSIGFAPEPSGGSTFWFTVPYRVKTN